MNRKEDMHSETQMKKSSDSEQDKGKEKEGERKRKKAGTHNGTKNTERKRTPGNRPQKL